MMTRSDAGSMTARLCAFARAYHSGLGKSKIFDDYLAHDMIGKNDYDNIGTLIKNDGDDSTVSRRYGFESLWTFELMDRFYSPVILSRAAFAERALCRFVRKNHEAQYVICGAGLDTFAFRNMWANLRIFELDKKSTHEHKLKRIKELHWDIPDNASYAAIDFKRGNLVDTLLKAGFDVKKPTFFSILGVAYYLSADEFESLIGQISILSDDSRCELVFDFPDDGASGNRAWLNRMARLTASLGEPMEKGFSIDEMRSLLSRRSFSIIRHESPDEIQQDFFLGRIDGQKAPDDVHFILARSMKTMKNKNSTSKEVHEHERI
ncbi:MAG: class I SAM-dependent methyltransferase [Schwartzia sp.]|nr:class I SAM-dependent methyltransferase [Schwartzia sp. (in: firmicutes)]